MPNSRLISTVKFLLKAAIAISILIGCLVLAGWIWDIPTLKSIFPGLATMKVSTACAFVLSGVSLWLLQKQQADQLRHRIGQLCAFVVGIIGCLRFSNYIFQWHLDIGRLLFSHLPAAFTTSELNQMAPNTALSFILISLALILLGEKTLKRYWIAQLLTLTAAFVSLLALIGYTYEVKSFYQIPLYSGMALHTALTFSILCLGILLLHPEQGLMKIVMSNSTAGFIARRLLLAAMIIPSIAGFLVVQGYRAGLYRTEFGISLLVITNIIVFVVWIWQNAQTLDKLDHRRQKVEEELQEALSTLESLIQASPLAIISFDGDAKLKLWSPAAEHIFGWKAQEVLGRFIPFVPEHKQKEFHRWHQLKLKSNLLTGVEAHCHKKDGSPIDVAIWGAPLRDGKGNINSTMAIIADITERKRTQEQLQETLATLQALIQACPLGITVFSLDDGKVKMWNPAAEKIFGWSEQEVLGHFLPSVAADQQQEFLDNLNFIRQGKTLTGRETRRQKKDGSLIDIGIWAAPLQDAQGNVNCMSIVADISDRKRLEEERTRLLTSEQAARADAEAANRMKDEFLATLSHELRTPMNAISGWTHLLRTRKFNEATIARALETIDRNSHSLSQLIEDVLDVSRIVRGKLCLNMRPVDLICVVEAAIDTVIPAATLKEIQIESFFADAVGQVLGDGNRLQQVIWNLLSNAVKFTPKGGRVEVRVSVVEESGGDEELGRQGGLYNFQHPAPNSQHPTPNSPYIQIQVRDTGKGIKREFLPYVFERFRQENNTTTRSYGGLGLGLAIVRHLVELHGGTVAADSLGEGQGATFSVQLPLVSTFTETSNQSLVSSGVEDKVLLDSLPALDGLKVLVVDDEADARDLVATMLSQYGVEATTATCASEGFEALQRLKPDVLVSDIGMPGENGYALIRKIRTLDVQQGGQIPAIALTAYARAEDRDNAIAAGFQQHISKPINPVELAVVVANLVGRCGNI